MSDPTVNVNSGGFLKGYRTYIAAALTVATAVAGYAVGDIGLVPAITAVVTALGTVFAAHH